MAIALVIGVLVLLGKVDRSTPLEVIAGKGAYELLPFVCGPGSGPRWLLVLVAGVAEPDEADGQVLVPVEVGNRGDDAAASVQVAAELRIGSEVTTGELIIEVVGFAQP